MNSLEFDSLHLFLMDPLNISLINQQEGFHHLPLMHVGKLLADNNSYIIFAPLICSKIRQQF